MPATIKPDRGQTQLRRHSGQGNIRTGKCYASIKDRGEGKERKQVFI